MTGVLTPERGWCVISYSGVDVGGTEVACRAEPDTAGEVTESSFSWPRPGGDAPEDLRLLTAQVARLRLPEPITAVRVSVPATDQPPAHVDMVAGRGRGDLPQLRPGKCNADYGAFDVVAVNS